MLTFSINLVRDVIARGLKDAEANGGFRDPYYGLKLGEGEKPGVWLVGDEGVYLMSTGALAEGGKPLVVYALECDPKTNADWFHDKRRLYGGDDGVDFIDAETLQSLFDKAPEATHLRITMSETALSFDLLRLKPSPTR